MTTEADVERILYILTCDYWGPVLTAEQDLLNFFYQICRQFTLYSVCLLPMYWYANPCILFKVGGYYRLAPVPQGIQGFW